MGTLLTMKVTHTKDETHRCQPTTEKQTFRQHEEHVSLRDRTLTKPIRQEENMQLRKAGVMMNGNWTEQAISRTVWKNVNRPGTHPRGDQPMSL